LQELRIFPLRILSHWGRTVGKKLREHPSYHPH